MSVDKTAMAAENPPALNSAKTLTKLDEKA